MVLHLSWYSHAFGRLLVKRQHTQSNKFGIQLHLGMHSHAFGRLMAHPISLSGWSMHWTISCARSNLFTKWQSYPAPTSQYNEKPGCAKAHVLFEKGVDLFRSPGRQELGTTSEKQRRVGHEILTLLSQTLLCVNPGLEDAY